MTETIANKRGDMDRNLALLNYGLLFSSIFFAGIPALIAVIIAYSQRGEAAPAIRSHHDYQIRIFWVAFVLTMIAAACGLGAVIIGIGEMVQFGIGGGFDGWEGVTIDLDDVRLDGGFVILTVTTIILSLLTAIWLIAAPAIGFVRLASERAIGNTAA